MMIIGNSTRRLGNGPKIRSEDVLSRIERKLRRLEVMVAINAILMLVVLVSL